jgi:manganese-dependent inorganic pyrophosphatase
MKKGIVIGHLKPDTDSIVSAYVFAKFLNETQKEVEYLPLMTEKENKETAFVFKKWQIDLPQIINQENRVADEVVLVDHNEEKQIHKSVDKEKIERVVDHHMINFSKDHPIYYHSEPIGSTSSLLYKLYKEKGLSLDKQMAGLLLSGILSDTLCFKSPTTTEEDKDFAKELQAIAEIKDLEQYSLEMFEKKSDLADFTSEEILMADFKEFEMGSKNAGIGVLETTKSAFALERKNELLKAMKKVKEEKKLDFIFFFIVDILKERSVALVIDAEDQKLLEKLFGEGRKAQENVLDTGKIMSRKKEIVPVLMKELS